MDTGTHEGEAEIDLLELFDLMQKFSNLGDAMGSQSKEAAELYFNSSDEPMVDGEMNPNVFGLGG